MSFSISRTAAASGILLKTGAVALFAGFSLSLALSCAPLLLFSGQQIKIDFEGWRWLKSVEFGVNAPVTEAAKVQESSRLERLLAQAEVAPKTVPSVAPIEVRTSLKSSAKVRRAKVKPSLTDRVTTMAAAPVRATADIATERAKLLGVYRLMRGRFHAAVVANTDTQLAAMNTQAAEPVSIQSTPKINFSSKEPQKGLSAKVSPAKRVEKRQARIPAQLTKAVTPVIIHEIKPIAQEVRIDSDATRPNFEAAPANTLKDGVTTSTPSAPITKTQSREAESAKRTNSVVVETKDMDAQRDPLPLPVNDQEPSAAVSPSYGTVQQRVAASAAMDTRGPVAIQDSAVTSSVVSGIIMKTGGYSLNSRSQIANALTPPPGPPARPKRSKAKTSHASLLLVPQMDPLEDTIGMQMAAADISTEQGAPALEDELPPVQTHAFVEAFRWADSVHGVSTQWISRDAEADRGWAVHRAQGFVPTLSWHSGDSNPTPLLSNNSALLLAKMADVKLHPALGMVFGKLPAGWVVELSGRAEQPVFVENTFAFLNVEPGARILYLSRSASPSGPHRGDQETAIGIPVISGTVTYMDIAEPTRRNIHGRVLSADLNRAQGLEGIQVNVAGQARAAVTDRKGRFTIEDVGTIGSYPLFIDTDSTVGYRHRYTLTPSDLGSLTLFQVSQHQIRDWVSQVEGGVSPGSGIVVAALPKLAAKHASSGMRLLPGVRPLGDRGGLDPEAYVLSQDGEMLAGKPMSAENSRFVVIEIPEGPAVTFVGDASGRKWSELIVAQPGVINVIGPR